MMASRILRGKFIQTGELFQARRQQAANDEYVKKLLK
jgi:hypothetical protein